MKPVAAPFLVALAALSCSPANVGGPIADAGSDTSADSSTDGGANATQACLNRAYAYCTQLQTCSTTAIEYRYGDVQTCKTLIAGECEVSAAAPSTGTSIAQIEACTAVEPTWACGDIIHSQNPPPACAAPPGPFANGTACTVNAQCQSSWCSHPPGKACGACAPPPNPGDPCDGNECPLPLVCSTSTLTCGAYVEAGGQCNAGNLCDSGLTCVGGICEAGVTVANMPCVFAGPGCDQFSGLACNAQSGTCKTLQLIQGGAACGTVANQPTLCEVGYCNRGACVGYAGLGEECDLAAGPECAANLRCIVTSDGGTAGICQILGGGSCP
jgi:hypothetical protein